VGELECPCEATPSGPVRRASGQLPDEATEDERIPQISLPACVIDAGKGVRPYQAPREIMYVTAPCRVVFQWKSSREISWCVLTSRLIDWLLR
jgi:hypothetical protein